MNLALYLIIGLALGAVLPPESTWIDVVLVLGVTALVAIIDVRSYKKGLREGRDIAMRALFATMHDKDIEAIYFKKKTQP